MLQIIKNSFTKLLLLLFLFVATLPTLAQTILLGQVTDSITQQGLAGVHIQLKDKMIGTTTDNTGSFRLTITQKLPIILVFSLLGYQSKEKLISNNEKILLNLTEQAIMGQEVVVSASRVEQNILESPVAIEKIGLRQLKQIANNDFYASLSSLKGVDVVASSLNYKTVNVRGFATNGNQRLVQLVDGMDNNAPGLGFAAGNLIGLSDLDLESMELLQGTASALYGANAISGALLMQSKNPFQYQGASTFVRTGVNNVGSENGAKLYVEGGLRYAKAFFKDRLAFKFTTYGMNGTDWAANTYADRNSLQNLQKPQNPAHEGINLYGDEATFFIPSVAQNLLQQGALTQNAYNLVKENNNNINRTGYKEQEIADYKIRNIKLNGALHYRITTNLEAIAQVNYGEGTSNYTGGNRFCFRNFSMFQAKTELKSSNFYLRLYHTATNSGDTYDISTLGSLLNEVASPTDIWAKEYVKNYAQNLSNGQNDTDAQNNARLFADRNRILPNTERFFAVKDSLTRIAQPAGAGFVDRSRMWQAEGMYNFSSLFKFVEVITGFNYRISRLDSKGTLFADKNGRILEIHELGGYLQVAKSFYQDRIKITSSVRYDKNQNFAGQFTPRVGAVVQFLPNHYLRFSYQTGFRVPTAQNQYIDLDVIRGRAIGGLPEFIERYQLIQNPVYTLQAIRDSLLDRKPLQAYTFQEFKPEKVQSFEIGYRAIIRNMFSIDAYYYQNYYTDFIKNITFVQSKTGTISGLLANNVQGYLMPVNDSRQVESNGYGITFSVALPKDFLFHTNFSADKLLTQFAANEIAEYNTPPFRYNIGLSNTKFWKKTGFAINYRWQDSFIWESTFATGKVPSYGSLDAQFSIQLPRYKGQIKIGGSNILNAYNLQAFGNPQVGAVYYVQILLDELF